MYKGGEYREFYDINMKVTGPLNLSIRETWQYKVNIGGYRILQT